MRVGDLEGGGGAKDVYFLPCMAIIIIAGTERQASII